MKGFVDIHSHFLPGLDDGPDDFSQCLKTAGRYRALGFKSIIATPHFIRSSGWEALPENIMQSCEKTEEKLHTAGFPLRILPGMEIAYTQYFQDDLHASRLLSLGKSGYYLLEFPMHSIAASLLESFKKIWFGESVKIILAHPERCKAFQDNTSLLQDIVQKGIYVQLTVDSLFGCFGSKVLKTAVDFLSSGLVHFLATDSHAGNKRLPPDIHNWKKLETFLGRKNLEKAFCINPRLLLAGESVAPLQMDAEICRKSFPGIFDSNAGSAGLFSKNYGLRKNLFRFLGKKSCL